MAEQVPPPAPPSADMSGRPGPVSDTSKLLAAISYPLWIPALIAILIEPYKDEKFVKFHAIQALGLGIAYFIIEMVIWVIPILGWIVGAILPFVYIIYTILLALKAYKGEYFEVPLVYGLVKGMVGE